MSIRFAVLGIAQVCCRAKDIRDEDSVTNAVISVLFLFLCAFAWDPLQVLVCNGRTTLCFVAEFGTSYWLRKHTLLGVMYLACLSWERCTVVLWGNVWLIIWFGGQILWNIRVATWSVQGARSSLIFVLLVQGICLLSWACQILFFVILGQSWFVGMHSFKCPHAHHL